MPRPSRRSDIIETAITLFCQNGFHGTSVDLIMVAAKVSKKTLYTYFRSKDELILACLQHYDGLFRNNFMKQVENTAPLPKEKLLGIFDVAKGWFMQNSFFGCMFINVIGEYSEQDTPLRNIARNFKAQLRAFIRELCVEAGAKEPDSLADALALLLEGAIVTAQVNNKPEAADIAKQAARAVIGQYFASADASDPIYT